MRISDWSSDVCSSDLTRAFAEDGYAGLEHALRGIDWDGFGGRFVIMITDASSREGNSPLSTTQMSTDQVRQLALENQTAIYVLHLLDRKSVVTGQSGSVRVDLGGRRIIKKKKITQEKNQ